jgi:hypothetical protein
VRHRKKIDKKIDGKEAFVQESVVTNAYRVDKKTQFKFRFTTR